MSDPREERIEEMERLVVSYQVRKQSVQNVIVLVNK